MGGDATRQDAAQRRRSGVVVGIIRYRGIQSHFTRTGCDLPSCPPVHLFMSTILYKYIASSPLRLGRCNFVLGKQVDTTVCTWFGRSTRVPRLVLPRTWPAESEKRKLLGWHILPSRVRPTYTARFLSLNGRSRLNLCSSTMPCVG